MIETSPSHVVVAHRVTPLTSRGVPVFLAGKEQKNIEHFPPTPEPDTSEFGTVSMHKPSHSFSHARTYVPHNPSETPSFSAVVHAKVTETAPAPAPSASYKDFYAKVPETPQVNRTPAETPMSPGYGELATLLHEAALLELTLEQGELPTEAMRQEESERKQREEQEQKEREKEAAARAKVEEERRKHAAVAKARAKQEATESKSKSSFRNPLLRSKNSHKRGVSTDSQASRASNEPVRHKSVVQQASSIDSIPETVDVDARTSSQTSPKSPSRYFTSLRRLASTSRPSTSISQYSRNSVSASSEISSEDSASIPTPPGNGMYSAGSHANGSTAGSERSSIFGGNGIAWPSLSPKKSPNMGRAASFADKMFNRGRTKSTVSTNSPYDAVGMSLVFLGQCLRVVSLTCATDRLTKSRAAKSAAALIPPLDPISFTLDVPVVDDKDLPSPRRSASLYVPSLSSFPPTYATKPTSPVYTSQVTASLDSMLSERLTSPVYNPQQAPSHGMQSLDTLFSAKPTSPVYTPHIPAMKSEETITDSLMPSPNPSSLLPSPQHHNSNRSSWISGVSDLSMDSSTSSIPSPFFDSFPSVPEDTPLPPALPGRRRNFHRPSLPLPAPSFFEPAPLSSAAVGSEFSPAPTPILHRLVAKETRKAT
ncbi:hypothetical protein DXG03_001343 [Asterophora parasitica]|nr:hypothetical protein DXG03_001343 [Asterophora parasitica]